MYSFDPIKLRDKIIKGIRDLAKSQDFKKVVVGISGGKDSTVTAALCVRALGKENVYGVMLPDGEQKDIGDSIRVCNILNIPNIIINIKTIHDIMLGEIRYADGHTSNGVHILEENEKEADINIPPRVRMTVLRYITQSLGARLAGTGNLSEVVVGYCTKDGDTSCDFSVLGALTSVEVVQVGLTMHELPEELVKKIPSDGLCGMSDEEKLGVSYADIHNYLRNISPLPEETYKKIHKLDKANIHKRTRPPVVYIPECDGV